MEQPVLRTEHLLLRPFALTDAESVRRLAGNPLIADTTAAIPHPYPAGEAERWIAVSQKNIEAGELLNYAITRAEDGELLGSVSLMHIDRGEAELGYWVGVPFWGRGIATAAARQLVRHGFDALGLRRIHARVLSRNPASRRVLLSLGFVHTGTETAACGERPQAEPIDYYERLA
jgi:RimJ/RimL family protein N-acetyltransferase